MTSSPPPPPTGLLYRVDGESLNTLIEKYEKSLSTNTTEKERVEKLRQEYLNLKSKLSTLPQQIEYNALVPLGRRALCPGKIVHTNEITCLLGDNWFVECSAAKAIEIANHRIAKLDEQYEGLRKERDLLNNWKQEAERQLVETIGEGTVEIREDYIEDHEKHWRQQHRESVRRHHQQLAKDRIQAKQEKTSDNELWSRLDELELQEDLENYLEQEVENEEIQKKIEQSLAADKVYPERRNTTTENERKTNSTEPISKPAPRSNEKTETKSNPPSIRKRVKFSADNIIHDISDDSGYQNQESCNQEDNPSTVGFTDDSTISSYPCFDPIMIRFRHTSPAELKDGDSNASDTEEADQTSQIVSSPGDIVKIFGPTSISAISNKPLPKSILKPYKPPLVLGDKIPSKAQTKGTTRKNAKSLIEEDDNDIDEMATAVSKVVTERVPVFTSLQLNSPTLPSVGESETDVRKPVSLFKMRRQSEFAPVSSPD